MFGTLVGGENPRAGRPDKNWTQRLTDDPRVFRDTDGSTENALYACGVEAVSMAHGGYEAWGCIEESSKRRDIS